ncbi:glyoxalase [Streptococcus sp. E17BB]|uniref:glyoxalase n=1 Tax=Streptococcus sp. E17BB TaxID=3278714 RepID=UPI00359EB050
MFNNPYKTMIYVADVEAEKNFWSKMGFIIVKEDIILEFPTFEMKISPDSQTSFVVYSTAFIEQYSPELLGNQPNLLFFTHNIEMVYQLVKTVSPAVSDLNELPYKNFSFESPNRQFYTVREEESY